MYRVALRLLLALPLAIFLLVSPGETRIVTRVNTNSAGLQANMDGWHAVLSADGRYVAFMSGDSNLVPGDTNGFPDVFIKDTQTGQISMVSTDSAGRPGNGYSDVPSISTDGRYVAFWSDASNLVPGDTNGFRDVFVKNIQTGQITRVSTDSAGVQANAGSATENPYPGISPDGRYAAFSSHASNLVAGDTNGHMDVFLKDTQTGRTTRISTDSAGQQANEHSDITGSLPIFSADGRYMAFASVASNLVPGDTKTCVDDYSWGSVTHNCYDVFVKDTQTGQTTLVSSSSTGEGGDGSSWDPTISADGRYVAFYSEASDLVPGDTNMCLNFLGNLRGCGDIFVKDTHTGLIARVSTASAGDQASGGLSTYPSISADGRYVGFWSNATNLVSNDTNQSADVFVKDTVTGQTARASTDSQGIQANAGSVGQISADGQSAVFVSGATNLASGDTNGKRDVFLVTTEAVALSAPAGLVVSSTGSALGLSWSPAPGDEDVAGYEVERSTSGAGPFAQIGTTGSNSYTDSTAAVNTRYYYRVRAYDVFGNRSDYSSVAEGIIENPPPSVPANFTLNRLGGSFLLGWSASTDDEAVTGYKLEKAASPGGPWIQIATLAETGFTDIALASDSLYYYRVRAYDPQGNHSGYSELASARSLVIFNVLKEESTPDMKWTGSGWRLVRSSYYSGGYTKYTKTAGNALEVPFRGTAVSWVGTKASNRGKADVYIDGVYQTTIDQYQLKTAYKQTLFSNVGLTDVDHTLKIVATGTKRTEATSAYTDIDAVGINGYSPGVNLEDSATLAVWKGTWTPLSGLYFSAGSTRYTLAASSSVELTFKSASIALIGAKAFDRGKANVYIDGLLQTTIDLYSPSVAYQQVLYAKTGLSNSYHKLKIVATGSKNANSSGSYVEVDAFTPGIPVGVSVSP